VVPISSLCPFFKKMFSLYSIPFSIALINAVPFYKQTNKQAYSWLSALFVLLSIKISFNDKLIATTREFLIILEIDPIWKRLHFFGQHS